SLGFLAELQREFGDVVCVRLGPLRTLLLSRPEHVHHVMVTHHRNYEKGDLFAKLKPVAGDGLLFSEGEKWRRERRWVGPVFQRAYVQNVVPTMGRLMHEVLDGWERKHAGGQTFDLMPELSRLALDMVCRALFGAEPPGASFHDRIDEGLAHANYLLNHYLTPPLWVPTRRNRAARRTLEGIHDAIRHMLAAARADPERSGDLMRRLVEARDEETGEPVGEAALIDQMITLLVAGHETTAMALCWSFHLLGQHPEASARLREEADAVLGDTAPDAAAVERLEFATRVVKESLRLYPPIWAIPRQAKSEDAIGGYRVPRRTMVTLSPWLTHRHPEFWDEPLAFDPDRFSEERSRERPRHAYFPFGAGGRSCVGEDFAMLEATLALAMTVHRFDVRPVTDHPMIPDPILTLRPRFGLRVRLDSR
ncbi:MAG: cytochrome P450, partial [Proteobacteria bacterium]|nr:cytochrome P450 [Pseudomonadota bacterium]